MGYRSALAYARAACLAACLAAAPLIAVALSSTAGAQQFNQFIAFGDSTLDSGWYYTHLHDTDPSLEALYKASQAIGGGIPTTPGGPMNSQVLASLFGLTAIPVGEPGGTNYAAGGASNITYADYSTPAPNTVSQTQSYLAADGGAANPNALYLISSGGNDINQAICPNGICVGNAAQLATASAADLVAAIAQLHAAGARYFVVAIDYGAAPGGNTSSAAAQTFSAYNQALYGGLAADGINFIPVSGKVIANAVGYNSALFGITNTQPGSTVTHQGGACVNPNPGNGTGGTIAAAWSSYCTTLVAPNAEQTYLFADNEHYSAAGQLIEGDYAYSLIVAPEEMSYLAEVPVKTRTAVVDSIEQQVMISGRNRAVGTFNSWVTGDISSLKMDTGYNGFPSDPGTPGMVTVGADYLLAPNWLVGGAVSVGTTTQSFSLGGNFRQNEYALSGYAAYVGRPLWLDVVASYGGLHYNTDRIVPIGVTTVSNTGSTNGQNASFAAEVGYTFATGPGGGWTPAPMLTKAPPAPAPFNFTYGPVAGIIVQHIDVNGFAESDPFAGDASGGFTALTYAGQVRNSAVTELGVQAGVDVGLWHPYGKLVWNHELDSDNRVVTAFEPEIAFAPGYSMPAVSFGQDWGSATVGTTYNLGHGMTAYASFNSEFGESEVTYYGGQIGLNVALGAPPPAPVVAKE
jgi:outer membrane lipase/esterase